ncbi:FAD-binding oxidoreductase [bacterium SCSIO 12827]|nr:FAD-binding oxidoreductase [bacterium SCSIO 12827]
MTATISQPKPENSKSVPQGGTPGETTVCVIGAGIVGVNCALAAVKEGFKVTLIDRIEPGEACSFGNAGILAEWSFVPTFGPEVLRNVPGYLLDPKGPLTIRWSRLPHILPWLLRMLRFASVSHQRRAADALRHLTIGCSDAYGALAAEAGAPELVRRDPVLQVYDNESDFKKAEIDLAFRATYGIKYQALDRKELTDLEPALGPDFKWAHALLGGGTTTNPGRLTKVLAEAFVKRGGTLKQGEVRGLVRKPDGGFRIETPEGTIEADRIVLAAGAFSHKLAALLGEKIPLGTERGYHAILADPGVQVNHAVGWKARAFYASPMEMGLRLAGTVELAGLEPPPDYARVKVMTDLVPKLLPGVKTEVSTQWMGFRPTLPDSLPVVGPSTTVPGLFHAFGHQHVGLTCGPATGRVIARLLKGEAPNVDLTPFRADRF